MRQLVLCLVLWRSRNIPKRRRSLRSKHLGARILFRIKSLPSQVTRSQKARRTLNKIKTLSRETTRLIRRLNSLQMTLMTILIFGFRVSTYYWRVRTGWDFGGVLIAACKGQTENYIGYIPRFNTLRNSMSVDAKTKTHRAPHETWKCVGSHSFAIQNDPQFF